jgi:hypothetical protein
MQTLALVQTHPFWIIHHYEQGFKGLCDFASKGPQGKKTPTPKKISNKM